MGKHKVGFFPGVWDFLHAGHVLALAEAKKHCKKLVVGLKADPSIDQPAKNRPIMTVKERAIMLEACKYVDKVVLYQSEEELYELDAWYPHDVRFMGADHKGEHPHIQKPIVYVTRDHEYSSTDIRRRCAT